MSALDTPHMIDDVSPNSNFPPTCPDRPVLAPVPVVARMGAYRPPKPPARVDGADDAAATPPMLRLDRNEGPRPDASLRTALAELDDAAFNRYPDAASVEARLALDHRLDRSAVLLTSGGNDAIDRCTRAMLGPGRDAVIAGPTFEMIERCARLTGGHVVNVPWLEPRFPLEAMLERVGARTRLVAVVTPNNPSGAIAPARVIDRLAEAAPHALILIDGAYAEFADDDPTPAALSHPNVVVVRTFSKAWGLAGLRVGCALGDPAVIGWLRTVGDPYPVSGPALAIVGRALESGRARMWRHVRRVRSERDRLAGLLRTLGAEPVPSQANFVLARFDDAAGVKQRLADAGVLVRAFPHRPGYRDALRITCPGDRAEFMRLSHALVDACATASASVESKA